MKVIIEKNKTKSCSTFIYNYEMKAVLILTTNIVSFYVLKEFLIFFNYEKF